MAKGRFGTFGLAVALGFAWLPSILPAAPARSESNPPELKLLISIEQQALTEPYPARITLHLHNASPHTLWLYRRARAKRPPVERVYDENRPAETSGESTLEVKLQPADAAVAQAATSPAEGTALEYVGLPKPKLVKLAAGDDYEEKAILPLRPALAEGHKPIWGVYQLAVIYEASFSNADEFQRNLGATLWQGEVTSNVLAIELRPAPGDAVGVAAGSAVGADLQPRTAIRISLSDEQERLIGQQITGPDGRFSFDHLPLGLYWVTARHEGATADTAVFQHVELTSATPRAGTQLVLYPPEIYEPQKVLHKPVLFKIVDTSGQPADKVTLDATWANGSVLDDVKAATADDGMAVMELIPGRNFVALKRRGCHEQQERADVAPGEGADSFKLVFDCPKK
ncbi:MAG: carboxypeptidase-like regulatory domain-containing protein [Acidobacteriia bacterium]|nr:carboxypeptidase-like regulatory domain-containing protein [Terriglobia bacterium]